MNILESRAGLLRRSGEWAFGTRVDRKDSCDGFQFLKRLNGWNPQRIIDRRMEKMGSRRSDSGNRVDLLAKGMKRDGDSIMESWAKPSHNNVRAVRKTKSTHYDGVCACTPSGVPR
jgi:hypothetical protein